MSGLSINTSVASMRTQRMLADATDRLSNSFNRLSSGSRINSASDDAAGLAVADQLRVAKRVQSGAIRNINDAVSVINIASSTLSSQTAMITRMMELAEQASNGSLSTAQRRSLNQEYRAMMFEFGRHGDTAAFNGLKLLLGDRSAGVGDIFIQAGLDGSVNSGLKIGKTDTGSMSGTINIDQLRSLAVNPSTALSMDELSQTYNGYLFNVTFQDSQGVSHDAYLGLSHSAGSQVTFAIWAKGNETDGVVSTDPNKYVNIIQNASTAYVTINASTGKSTSATWSGNLTPGGPGHLANGANGSFSVNVEALVFTSYSGVNAPALGDTSVLELSGVESQDRATRALTLLTTRLQQLSAFQGNLGAFQNRIMSAKSVTETLLEANSAAESRIRDVDVASEMSTSVRDRILQQSATSVLANANNSPKILLDLLKNA